MLRLVLQYLLRLLHLKTVDVPASVHVRQRQDGRKP
jgi:hypothetical protein